jgi:hypothetical protein
MHGKPWSELSVEVDNTTDINLTGPIAANLVENMKPTIWSSAILFGVVTAIITSVITYITVRYTNAAAEKREEKNREAAEKREEKNRNEEARRTQREERKKAYGQITTTLTKMHLMIRNKSYKLDENSLLEFLNEYAQSMSDFRLLNPELADSLDTILINSLNPENRPDLETAIGNFSAQFKREILPKMQADLAAEGTNIRQPKSVVERSFVEDLLPRT